MSEALIAGVVAIVVALVGLVGSYIAKRNDRALTAQELDLIEKLPVGSEPRRELMFVVERRVFTWYQRSRSVNGVLRNALLLLLGAIVFQVLGTILGPDEMRGYLANRVPPLVRTLTFLQWALAAVATLLFVGGIVLYIKDLVETGQEIKAHRRLNPGRFTEWTTAVDQPPSPPGAAQALGAPAPEPARPTETTAQPASEPGKPEGTTEAAGQ